MLLWFRLLKRKNMKKHAKQASQMPQIGGSMIVFTSPELIKKKREKTVSDCFLWDLSSLPILNLEVYK